MSNDPTTQVRPALHPGDKISYFEVQSPLAAGGMSLVWKGRDSVLNRDVAIKQLAAFDEADEEFRERFRKEAEIQKKVSASHANLVQVIEFIEDERGLFIVMEYVDGSSLDRVLAKLDGPMDPKQALGIMHQVAVALSAIHEANVLHRDLKPSNILLPRDGGVKVCDFGLATLVDEQEALTMGTARYMAPEMFTDADADGRADVYSLGMIAYEMLIGRPKFEEQFRTVLRDQRNQALRWMKWHTNQRLTATPAGRLVPELPEELSDIIERLMAKDPALRIGSALMLIDVLKRNFSTAGRARAAAEAAKQAVTSQVHSPSEPTAPLPTRSRMPIVLGVVLLSQVIIIGGIFAYLEMQKGEQLEQQQQLAFADYAAAKRLYESGDYPAARDAFAVVIDKWESVVPEQALFSRIRSLMATGFIQRDRGLVLMDEGNYSAATAAFDLSRQAFEDADSAIPANHGGLLKQRDELARERKRSLDFYAFAEPASKIKAMIDSGRFNEARLTIRELRSTGKQRLPKEDEILNAFNDRITQLTKASEINEVFAEAERKIDAGQFDEALQMLEESRSRLESSAFDEDIKKLEIEITYRATLRKAEMAQQRGDLAKAIVEYKAVIDIRPTEQLRQTLRELQSRYEYEEGKRLQALGDIDGAAARYNNSNNYLPNEPATSALAAIGRAAEKSAKVQEGDVAYASGDWEKAIGAWKVALGMAHDATTESKINNAYTRLYAGRAEEAMMDWRLADCREAVNAGLGYDTGDPQLLRTKALLEIAEQYQALVDRGDALYRQGKFGQAGPVFRKAREVIKGSQIDSSPVSKKIQDAEYESWMVKARTAYEARQWRQAMGYVSAAKNIRVTAEVSELETKVRAELDDEDG